MLSKTYAAGGNSAPDKNARSAQSAPRETCRNRSIPMLDVIMLALGLALFALAVGYGYACERL
jgi:hypothetical protein